MENIEMQVLEAFFVPAKNRSACSAWDLPDLAEMAEMLKMAVA
jgi:hypothetical protein